MIANLVGGTWRPAETDAHLPVFDPATGEESERVPLSSRADVDAKWLQGWAMLQDALDSLTPADLDTPIVIRGQSASLPRALMRNLAHVAGHVHQIVLLAKHLRGSDWQTLSIPRGQSEQFRAGTAAGGAAPKGST